MEKSEIFVDTPHEITMGSMSIVYTIIIITIIISFSFYSLFFKNFVSISFFLVNKVNFIATPPEVCL